MVTGKRALIAMTVGALAVVGITAASGVSAGETVAGGATVTVTETATVPEIATAGPDSASFTAHLTASEFTADLLHRFGWEARSSLPVAPALADYLGYALAHSPAVAAALANWQADGEVGTQASALPDPRFSWGEMLVPVQTRTGPQQRIFSLSQTLPWFGKQSLRGKIADEQAAAAEARLVGVVLDVLFRVRRAYYDLAYLGEAVRITDRHLALVGQWEVVARARYAAGAGRFADMLKAQVEYSQLTDRLAELTDARRPAAAELNAALGQPATAPITWPATLPATAHAVAEDSLVAALLQRQPQLVALTHEEQSTVYAASLAGRQKYPDVTLGIDYIMTGESAIPATPDSGKDPVIARLAINVPLWWGKYAAAEREAAGRQRALEAARRDVTVGLQARLERVRFEHREAVRTVDLYGGSLLLKGRQALDAVTAAYETGEADFLDIVEAQQTLLAFELTEARARADRLISLARIEQLIAGPAPMLAATSDERGAR